MKRLMMVLSVISTATLLSACGANIDDLEAYTERVKANTQVTLKDYKEFSDLPSVSYDSTNLRSPFKRSQRERVEAYVTEQQNCDQPDQYRAKQPLERFGLDGLKMSGVFTNNGHKYALVTANDGSLHKVTIGSYMGLFHGRVTQVSNTEILITEMLPDGAGCWKSKQATLTMSSMVGENNNV